MFDNAIIKIEWAYTHFQNIEKAINGLGKGNNARFIVGIDPNSGTQFVNYYIGDYDSTNIALMIGDCIHNLRSSLDHAMWELMERDRGTQDSKTAFPFAGTQPCYETLCNRIETPRADTKKFFLGIEAFEGGKGSILYGLHRLNITDKHKILTPIITLTEIRKVEVELPNGQPFKMEFCQQMVDRSGMAKILHNIPAECRIECHDDSKPTLEIQFGNVRVFKFEPILETLFEIYNAVSCTISELRDFVSTRTP